MSVRILQGDCREKLAELPAESVHCVVTSPPYWGLRDYGVEGGIGLEPTLQEHINALVWIFREVRRVLRKNGTCWLNYGDAYAGSWGAQSRGNPCVETSTLAGGQVYAAPKGTHTGSTKRTPDLKPKDLLMMSARVAMALQADGWWLRKEIIWHKPNTPPESVTDRPTSAHEKLFILTRSGDTIFWTHRGCSGTRTKPPPDYRYVHRKTGEELLNIPAGADPSEWRRINLWRGHDYFYDAKAVRTVAVARTTKAPDGWDTDPGAHGTIHRKGRQKGTTTDKQRGHGRRHAGFNDRWDQMSKEEQQAGGANLRDVWTIATHPFSGAHFATFPPGLVERCIKLGTSEKGACAECGAPWVRDVKRTEYPRLAPVTLGWRPGCDCGAGVVPCTVLDPFAGAGTTGLVADKLGRHAILIELNPDYVKMARRRIQDDAPLLTEVM